MQSHRVRQRRFENQHSAVRNVRDVKHGIDNCLFFQRFYGPRNTHQFYQKHRVRGLSVQKPRTELPGHRSRVRGLQENVADRHDHGQLRGILSPGVDRKRFTLGRLHRNRLRTFGVAANISDRRQTQPDIATVRLHQEHTGNVHGKFRGRVLRPLVPGRTEGDNRVEPHAPVHVHFVQRSLFVLQHPAVGAGA